MRKWSPLCSTVIIRQPDNFRDFNNYVAATSQKRKLGGGVYGWLTLFMAEISFSNPDQGQRRQFSTEVVEKSVEKWGSEWRN